MDPTSEHNQKKSKYHRDHLFISYAWEDEVFAKWLALRLTAEGYKVWIDQFKLLGGESWPTDIDEAIKTRTFRMLGLLSQHSISKPNPVKERTLALNIAKQPGKEGILIPLNVDGLRATDLDWLTSDITFIPFNGSWAKGLAQLVKLLDREGCPKSTNDGRSIVSEIASASEVITATNETLTSNRCGFSQVPEQVKAYRVTPPLRKENGTFQDASRDWAFYLVSPQRVLAFHPPPDDLASWLRVEFAQSYQWQEVDELESIAPRNVVAKLLRAAVETRLRQKGFVWSAAAEAYAFPGKHGARVSVVLPNGEKTNVQPSGERTYFRIGLPKQKYRYRLSARLVVDFNSVEDCGLLWPLRFHLTDLEDNDLLSTRRHSRRKHLTRDWHNYDWLVRHLAVVQYCADDEGMIRIGEHGPGQVVLDCSPEEFQVPIGIDETKLGAIPKVSDEEADAVPVPKDFEDEGVDDDEEGEEDDE